MFLHSFVMNPVKMKLFVETYVGAFNIHYMCILSSEFVRYEHCDKMHSVYNMKYVNIKLSLWRYSSTHS
jgi:hypothetical protein